MAGPPPFDFLKDLQTAGQTASEQEAQTRELLREMIFVRAERDPEFKKALASNPEQVVQEEARKIPTQGSQATEDVAQKIRTQVVEEVTREARERFSTAIIGASERQVTELVFGTLENVRTSFHRTIALSQWLFAVGLGLTVASFLVALFAGGKELIAGIFGGGGILTLISYAVMNPLDRIRNAAANLVQIQIAYVSYYKQLNMLGGSDGRPISLADAVKYSAELRRGAVETIAAVQSIVEKTAPYDPRTSAGASTGSGHPPKRAEEGGESR